MRWPLSRGIYALIATLSGLALKDALVGKHAGFLVSFLVSALFAIAIAVVLIPLASRVGGRSERGSIGDGSHRP
jgi:hypothetical protein